MLYSQMPAESWVALQRTLYPHWSQQQFEQHAGLRAGAASAQAAAGPCHRARSASCGWPLAGASAAELVLIDELLAALDKPSERYVQHALAAMAAELKNPARPAASSSRIGMPCRGGLGGCDGAGYIALNRAA